ncbi:MAG TPA: O-antigen ligase family protein [Candidatus Binatia bacterium]|nr:O-antigen ligase family protein [Candidatus Binatia bacterium]
MRTKLTTGVAALIEASWLSAVVLVPVFFNVSSHRVFEEDKIPLLRSLALLMASGGLLGVIDVGWRRTAAAIGEWWRTPLIRPAMALTASYALATAFSVAPRISWMGAYERGQGTYTWGSYIVVFGCVVALAQQRDRIEGAITAMILASVAPALYGVVQYLGRDPIVWTFDVTDRVVATLGNPIFFAGLMVMIIPLTLVRLTQWTMPVPERRSQRVAAGARAILYLMLLALQALGVAYSKSRGPFVAIVAGWAFSLLLFAAMRRWRMLKIGMAGSLVAVVACLVAVRSLGPGPKSTLIPYPRSVGGVGRIASITLDRGGSTRVRELIWRGTVALLGSDPRRAVLGYGPETLPLIYGPFFPPELAIYQGESLPDRTHNEVFESLVTTGVLGCLAELAMFVGAFAYGLRCLGVVDRMQARRRFVAANTIGAAIGAGVSYLITGDFAFSAPAAAGGIFVATIAVVLLHMRALPTDRPHTNDVLIVGLLASIMAHFVEIQFGIATVSTRLFCWVDLALLVALGRLDDQPRAAKSGRRPSAVMLAPIAGMAVAVLVFNFSAPSPSVTPSAPLAWSLPALAWLACVALMFGEAESTGSWINRLLSLGGLSAAVPVLFALTLTVWDASGSQAPVEVAIAHAANRISFCYVFVFVAIVGYALWRFRHASGQRAHHIRRLSACVVPVGGALAALIVWTNLNASRADVFSREGTLFDQRGDGAAAFFGYSEAARLQPKQDWYATNLGRFLIVVAAGTPASAGQRRNQYLERARIELERARALNPQYPDHSRNLARLHRAWAGFAADAGARARHVDQANAFYAETAHFVPKDVELLNEWAGMFVDLHEPAKALALLDRSLGSGRATASAYALRAQLRLESEQTEQALADCQTALDLDPYSLLSARVKARVLAQMGRLDQEVAETRKAVATRPQDAHRHRDLAVLYEVRGQLDLALTEADAALATASHDHRPQIERLIEDLKAAQSSREDPGEIASPDTPRR